MGRQLQLTSAFSLLLAALVACGGSSTVDGSGGGPTTTTTAGTTTGTTTSGQGGGTYTCSELVEAYAADIQAALACEPKLSKEQCTVKLPGDLECQCPVFVNPDNKGEVSALEAYLDEYETLMCTPGLACSCAEPKGASCQPDGTSSGKCVVEF